MAEKQILTHSKIRKLQRTLYQQAKKKPKWKAWSLYADLCCKEFIEEAMSRILSNRGGSGVDGYTVETMEADWDYYGDCCEPRLYASGEQFICRRNMRLKWERSLKPESWAISVTDF